MAYMVNTRQYGFYQDLQKFIKTSPLTRDYSKVLIGKLYNSVNNNLKTRGFMPINVYRFIETLVSQNHSGSSVVQYVNEKLETDTLKIQVQECSNVAQKLVTEIDGIKRERDESKKQLDYTQTALKDAVQEMQLIIKEFVVDLKRTSSVLRLPVSEDADTSYGTVEEIPIFTHPLN